MDKQQQQPHSGGLFSKWSGLFNLGGTNTRASSGIDREDKHKVSDNNNNIGGIDSIENNDKKLNQKRIKLLQQQDELIRCHQMKLEAMALEHRQLVYRKEQLKQCLLAQQQQQQQQQRQVAQHVITNDHQNGKISPSNGGHVPYSLWPYRHHQGPVDQHQITTNAPPSIYSHPPLVKTISGMLIDNNNDNKNNHNRHSGGYSTLAHPRKVSISLEKQLRCPATCPQSTEAAVAQLSQIEAQHKLYNYHNCRNHHYISGSHTMGRKQRVVFLRALHESPMASARTAKKNILVETHNNQSSVSHQQQQQQQHKYNHSTSGKDTDGRRDQVFRTISANYNPHKQHHNDHQLHQHNRQHTATVRSIKSSLTASSSIHRQSTSRQRVEDIFLQLTAIEDQQVASSNDSRQVIDSQKNTTTTATQDNNDTNDDDHHEVNINEVKMSMSEFSVDSLKRSLLEMDVGRSKKTNNKSYPNNKSSVVNNNDISAKCQSSHCVPSASASHYHHHQEEPTKRQETRSNDKQHYKQQQLDQSSIVCHNNCCQLNSGGGGGIDVSWACGMDGTLMGDSSGAPMPMDDGRLGRYLGSNDDSPRSTRAMATSQLIASSSSLLSVSSLTSAATAKNSSLAAANNPYKDSVTFNLGQNNKTIPTTRSSQSLSLLKLPKPVPPPVVPLYKELELQSTFDHHGAGDDADKQQKQKQEQRQGQGQGQGQKMERNQNHHQANHKDKHQQQQQRQQQSDPSSNRTKLELVENFDPNNNNHGHKHHHDDGTITSKQGDYDEEQNKTPTNEKVIATRQRTSILSYIKSQLLFSTTSANHQNPTSSARIDYLEDESSKINPQSNSNSNKDNRGVTMERHCSQSVIYDVPNDDCGQSSPPSSLSSARSQKTVGIHGDRSLLPPPPPPPPQPPQPARIPVPPQRTTTIKQQTKPLRSVLKTPISLSKSLDSNNNNEANGQTTIVEASRGHDDAPAISDDNRTQTHADKVVMICCPPSKYGQEEPETNETNESINTTHISYSTKYHLSVPMIPIKSVERKKLLDLDDLNDWCDEEDDDDYNNNNDVVFTQVEDSRLAPPIGRCSGRLSAIESHHDSSAIGGSSSGPGDDQHIPAYAVSDLADLQQANGISSSYFEHASIPSNDAIQAPPSLPPPNRHRLGQERSNYTTAPTPTSTLTPSSPPPSTAAPIPAPRPISSQFDCSAQTRFRQQQQQQTQKKAASQMPIPNGTKLEHSPIKDGHVVGVSTTSSTMQGTPAQAETNNGSMTSKCRSTIGDCNQLSNGGAISLGGDKSACEIIRNSSSDMTKHANCCRSTMEQQQQQFATDKPHYTNTDQSNLIDVIDNNSANNELNQSPSLSSRSQKSHRSKNNFDESHDDVYEHNKSLIVILENLHKQMVGPGESLDCFTGNTGNSFQSDGPKLTQQQQQQLLNTPNIPPDDSTTNSTTNEHNHQEQHVPMSCQETARGNKSACANVARYQPQHGDIGQNSNSNTYRQPSSGILKRTTTTLAKLSNNTTEPPSIEPTKPLMVEQEKYNNPRAKQNHSNSHSALLHQQHSSSISDVCDRGNKGPERGNFAPKHKDRNHLPPSKYISNWRVAANNQTDSSERPQQVDNIQDLTTIEQHNHIRTEQRGSATPKVDDNNDCPNGHQKSDNKESYPTTDAIITNHLHQADFKAPITLDGIVPSSTKNTIRRVSFVSQKSQFNGMGSANGHLSHSSSGSASSRTHAKISTGNNKINSLSNHHKNATHQPTGDVLSSKCAQNNKLRSLNTNSQQATQEFRSTKTKQPLLTTTTTTTMKTTTNSTSTSTRYNQTHAKSPVISNNSMIPDQSFAIPRTLKNKNNLQFSDRPQIELNDDGITDANKVEIIKPKSNGINNNNKLTFSKAIGERGEEEGVNLVDSILSNIFAINNEELACEGLDFMTSENHKHLDSIDDELRSKRNAINSAQLNKISSNNLDQMNITVVDNYINCSSSNSIASVRHHQSNATTERTKTITPIDATITKSLIEVDRDSDDIGKQNNSISSLRRQQMHILQTRNNKSLESDGDDLQDEEEEELCIGLVENGQAHEVRFIDSNTLKDSTMVRCPNKISSSEARWQRLPDKNNNGLDASIDKKGPNKDGTLIKSTSSSLTTTNTATISSGYNEGHHHVLSSHSFSCGSTSDRNVKFSKKHLVAPLNGSNKDPKLPIQYSQSKQEKYQHQSSFNSNCSNGQATDESSQNDDGQHSSSVSSRVSLSSSSFNDDENMISYDDDEYDDMAINSDDISSARCNLSSSSSTYQTTLSDLLKKSDSKLSTNDSPFRMNNQSNLDGTIYGDSNDSTSDILSLSQSPLPIIQANSSTYDYKISIATAKIDQENNQLEISQPKIITSGGELLTSATCDALNVSTPTVLASATMPAGLLEKRTMIPPVISVNGLNLSLSNPSRKEEGSMALALDSPNLVASTAITAMNIGSLVSVMSDVSPISVQSAPTPSFAEQTTVSSTDSSQPTAAVAAVSSTIVSPVSTIMTTTTSKLNSLPPGALIPSSVPSTQLTCRLDVGDTIKITNAIVDMPILSETPGFSDFLVSESDPCHNKTRQSCRSLTDDNKIILDVPGDNYQAMNRHSDHLVTNDFSADKSSYGYSAVSSISVNTRSSSENSSSSKLDAITMSSSKGGATLMIDDHIYEDIFEYRKIPNSSLCVDGFSKSMENGNNLSVTDDQSKFIMSTTTPITVCEFESPKKSIFEGASKDEILEYLEDARERVPEILIAADDVMMIGNGELIVVNQLDPDSPATPISIVEPSEVDAISRECVPLNKPNVNWQQRLYPHANHYDLRYRHQHQRSISSNSITSNFKVKNDPTEPLNELPSEDQVDTQEGGTEIVIRNSCALPSSPPLPPPRVSSITDRSDSIAEGNKTGPCKPSINTSIYQHANASSASSGSSSASSSLSSGISTSGGITAKIKSGSITKSGGSDQSSELNFKASPASPVISNTGVNRRYRTSNVSNVSNSSTESATTTGTNSSSGASMDTDDSADLENYYFDNELNLLETSLTVREALISPEINGNSSAASTLYSASLLSCSSPILKANDSGETPGVHLAPLPVISINQLGGSLTTISDVKKNSSYSQSDLIDSQSMSSNQSIVTLVSSGATPTKRSCEDISVTVQRNDSGIGTDTNVPINSSLKIKRSLKNSQGKANSMTTDIAVQKPSDALRQIKTSCINSTANYRQRTMPATSTINHRHHGQRRVFSSCDSSIEHQCADCDQFIDVDHSLVISGALKLQQQKSEQSDNYSNDDYERSSLLLDSYLMMPSIVCKSCEKKRVERKEIISEFVDTEFKYGRDLKIIHDEFFTPMQIAGLLSKDQINGIFLNLQELMLVHCRFAEKLRDAVKFANEQGDVDYTTVNIGKIFINSAEMLHAFESYCIRQGSAACLLARLAKEKELLRIFLRVSQMENTLLRRMNLAAFLMVPVQRVTKYPLLFNRLYKVTAYHHRDREALRDAQLKVELHLEHINQQTKGVGATTKIWRRISNLSATSNRRLISAEDIGHIKIRKAAIDLLKWNRDETQFIHYGRLHFSPVTEFFTKQRTGNRPLRYMAAHALLVVSGRPNHKYRPDLVTSSLDHKLMFSCNDNGIKEAALLLMREKNGRFIPCREALFLSNCVLSNNCSTFNDACQAFNLSQSPISTSSPVPMISACNQTNIKLIGGSPTQTQESITKSSGEPNASDNVLKNHSATKSNSTILNQLIRSKNSPPTNTSSTNMEIWNNSKTQQTVCQSSSSISNATPSTASAQPKQLSPSNSNFLSSNVLNNNSGLSNGNQNHLHHLNHHHQPYGDYQESFELHERLTKESILFKAETPLKTRYWLQLLRYHAKDLGQWRRRRNGLANIMIMRQD